VQRVIGERRAEALERVPAGFGMMLLDVWGDQAQDARGGWNHFMPDSIALDHTDMHNLFAVRSTAAPFLQATSRNTQAAQRRQEVC
jgi:hypothetical protein